MSLFDKITLNRLKNNIMYRIKTKKDIKTRFNMF